MPARHFARTASIRPTLDDVERLARGDATKRRGVGSRRVPHRLNADERQSYELALRKGFALVDGTGHRRHKDAKGAPLLNILRQRADALAQPLIWVERHRSGEWWYTCVDYSPVRAVETMLRELHERTLRVVDDEAIRFAHVESPWSSGPASYDADHRVVDEAITSSAIWAVPACVSRFSFLREDDVQRKECKRLAEVLSRELCGPARR